MSTNDSQNKAWHYKIIGNTLKSLLTWLEQAIFLLTSNASFASSASKERKLVRRFSRHCDVTLVSIRFSNKLVLFKVALKLKESFFIQSEAAVVLSPRLRSKLFRCVAYHDRIGKNFRLPPNKTNVYFLKYPVVKKIRGMFFIIRQKAWIDGQDVQVIKSM